MYPLSNWKTLKRGYLFGQPTSYSNHHLGTDYIVPVDTQIFAPFAGVVTAFVGSQLGETLFFKPNNLDIIIRMGHLDKVVKTGMVAEGDLIAFSDTSGSLSGGIPHVHLDISKHALNINNFANFIDPEKFDWETTVNIPLDFQTIWHRPPAKGEINYFSKRLLNGSITDEADMKVKMAFWYSVVYPNGKHSLLGDARWQLEKIKYL